ncbi:MAG TPA: carbohydrate kinase, partial [Spirochaetota bacterium]|nr:carbohydrate kinase [Spirochaetota bacterium]
NAGTIGATITCAVGLGLFKDFSDAKSFIPVDKIYEPNKANKARYDKNFNVFKELYGKNKKLFEQLNAC